MDKRAPRVSSIVGWFSPPPSQESAAGSVEPDVCLLVLVAAQAPLGVIREDAQNDSKLATTPGGRAGVGLAGLWPRSGKLARLLHVGRSGSPVQLKSY